MEKNYFTGSLIYKDIEFSYVFDKTESIIYLTAKNNSLVTALELISHKDEIAKGVYISGTPKLIDVDYLEASCDQRMQRIIFFVNGSFGMSNNVLNVHVYGYLIANDNNKFSRVGFECNEFNSIYPTNQAINKLKVDYEEGTFELTANGFKETTSNKSSFKVDGKEVTAYFGISYNLNNGNIKPPINLSTTLFFEFDETENFEFLYQLVRIAHAYLSFSNNRKDAKFSKIKLGVKSDAKEYINAGDYFLNHYCIDSMTEIDYTSLEKGQFIKYEYISSVFGVLLDIISKGNLYTRHIPKSRNEARNIDAAKFVMLTAAFEWEFKQLFENGIPVSKKRQEAYNNAHVSLIKLIDNTKGKNRREREIYKHLDSCIELVTLEDKINYFINEYNDVIEVFGKHIYSLNNAKYEPKEMAKRISKQRNDFAHGNLDKEFCGDAFLDLIFFERLVYSMQLIKLGLDKRTIQLAINELFKCNILIR